MMVHRSITWPDYDKTLVLVRDMKAPREKIEYTWASCRIARSVIEIMPLVSDPIFPFTPTPRAALDAILSAPRDRGPSLHDLRHERGIASV